MRELPTKPIVARIPVGIAARGRGRVGVRVRVWARGYKNDTPTKPIVPKEPSAE